MSNKKNRQKRTEELADKMVAKELAKQEVNDTNKVEVLPEETPEVVAEETIEEETPEVVVLEEEVPADKPELSNLATAIKMVKESTDITVVGRIDGKQVAAKQYGLLRVITAELGDKFTFRELEDAIVGAGIHEANVSHYGYLDWSFDIPSREAYAALIALLQLRQGGGIVFKDNLLELFTDDYGELGDTISSMI